MPAPLLFLAFMGLQGRYFGRWLLPIFPILCLLAAFFALHAAAAIARRLAHGASERRERALRVALFAAVTILLCGQGLVYSVHSGLVLSRADTRKLTRAWMVAHIPAGTAIVVEPVAPDGWAHALEQVPLARLADLAPRGA